mgnify:CR=1 FL=1
MDEYLGDDAAGWGERLKSVEAEQKDVQALREQAAGRPEQMAQSK